MKIASLGLIVFLIVVTLHLMILSTIVFAEDCGKIKQENITLKRKIAEIQRELESKGKAPSSVSAENKTAILLIDPTKKYEVKIMRILIGDACVKNNVFFEHTLENLRKQNKEIVYFEVSVKNINGIQVRNIFHDDFTLEDNGGNSYSSELTRDHIQGAIHHGKTARGGIAFAVYKGNVPQKLIWDTKYVYTATSEKMFAVADFLNKLKIFTELK